MKKCGLALIVGVIFCSLAGAREIYVPADFSTIQAGIGNANNGDIVIVSPGRYYENINFKGKNIAVTSTAPEDWSVVEATVIDGGGTGSVVTFSAGENQNSILRGFTITGGYGTLDSSLGINLHWGGGIYCKNSSPAITGNIITGNHGPMSHEDGYGGGIGCLQSNAVITGNIITSNETFAGGGISIYSGQPRISSNMIYSNVSVAGGGVVLLYGGLLINNTITENSAEVGGNVFARPNVGSGKDMIVNNIISNSQKAGGLYWDASSEYEAIAYNNIWGNVGGDYPNTANQTGYNGNISKDPLFVSPTADDYHLQPESPCINTGDPAFAAISNEKDIDGKSRILSALVDIGADEFSGYTIWYIHAGQSIQKAIDDANNGDVVIVSPGRYYENINFKGKNITVTGTAPEDWSVVEATILDGSRPVDPNRGSVVTFETGETRDAVIKGFTITGGTGTKSSSYYYGGGIYCKNSSPMIAYNIIDRNNVTKGGGAVYAITGTNILLYKNILKNNTADFGGAVYVANLIEIYNNIVCGNSARIGGGLNLRDTSMIINNLIYNNTSATYGGGIALNDADYSKISGNTIFGNSSATKGANLDIQFCDLIKFTNNIITNAKNSYGVYLYSSSGFIFQYNNVWNNDGGNYSGIEGQPQFIDNISADPLFVNSDSNDFRLQVNSPCINAGDPDYAISQDEVDIQGNPRIISTSVDIGAYEYGGNIIPVADAGMDQTFAEVSGTIYLDGSDSYDVGGDSLTYLWHQVSGPTVELANSDTVSPSFVPETLGIYVFELIVNDGQLDSLPDVIGIVIGNRAPIADAGLPKYAAKNPIVLDARNSFDPDGYGELSYRWSQKSGPTTLEITGTNTAEPLVSGFVQTSSVREYEFELIVSDGVYDSEPDYVKVTVVPSYISQELVIGNPPFNPDRPTVVAFGGGNCNTGSGMNWSGNWQSKVNWITVSSYSGPYTKYADMLIVLLSEFAPDYKMPIQTTGYSTGNMPAMQLAWHINRTYKEPRYAVNRVSLLDAVCSNLSSYVSQFHASPVGGEQCWVDNYITNDPQYRRADIIAGALNIYCNPARTHGYHYSRYLSSSFGYLNGGLDAFAYLSVIGQGKNYQLKTQANKYFFKIDTNENIVFYNQSLYPGKILAPVKLIETMAVDSFIDFNGVALTCQESENAVGYRLKVGADPYRVMDYNVISDTATPPDFIASDLPEDSKYWTVEAYDQYGSTIYADPLPLEYLACTGYEVVSQKRLSRTVFEYGIKMKVKNMCDHNVNGVTLKLSYVPEGIEILNDKVRFGNVAAGDEAASEDTFIVRIDRSKEYSENDYVWQITDEPESDLNADGTVNMADFVEFCRNWLVEEQDNKCDLYRDGVINYIDYAILAEQI